MDRKILAIVIIVLVIFGSYFAFIKVPQDKRIAPLLDAGLTTEQAIDFDNRYSDLAPYNQSVIDFSRFDSKYSELSAYGLNQFRDIRDISPFILFVRNQSLLETLYHRAPRVHDYKLTITSAANLLNKLNIDTLNFASVNLVYNLIVYNEGSRDVVDVYGSEILKNAINATENYPKINSDLNMYGNDWLVRFLGDNMGDEHYWQAVNAFAWVGQEHFYQIVTYTTSLRRTAEGLNAKYDPIERTITNERWAQLKYWDGKDELLIPIDAAKNILWNDEKVYINNLKTMILPHSLFYQKIDDPNAWTPGAFDYAREKYDIPPSGIPNSTAMALYNVRLMLEYHDNIWKRLNYSKTFNDNINSFVYYFQRYRDWPTLMKYRSEILQLFLEYGNFYDKACLAIDGISCREILKVLYIETRENHFFNLVSSVGGTGYYFSITYPRGARIYDPGEYESGRRFHHDTAGFPISDHLEGIFEDTSKYGRFLIHEDTNAICFMGLFEDLLEGETELDIISPFHADVYGE